MYIDKTPSDGPLQKLHLSLRNQKTVVVIENRWGCTSVLALFCGNRAHLVVILGGSRLWRFGVVDIVTDLSSDHASVGGESFTEMTALYPVHREPCSILTAFQSLFCVGMALPSG